MAYTILANLAAGNQPLSIIDANFAQAALLASPAFTGTPTAPTAAGGTNTNQLATTAFVQAATGSTAQSWTPADNSGASLTFTNVSANWVQTGNLVFAYFHLTFPSTADGTAVSIKGLPVLIANQNYAGIPTPLARPVGNGGASWVLPVKNTLTFQIQRTDTGNLAVNSDLSTLTLNGCVTYPAT